MSGFYPAGAGAAHAASCTAAQPCQSFHLYWRSPESPIVLEFGTILAVMALALWVRFRQITAPQKEE